MSEREQLAAEIDPQAKQILKEQDGYIWENLQRAIFQAYGGGSLDTPEAIDAELEQVRRERRDAVERRQKAEKEIDRLEQRITDLESMKQNLVEERDSKSEALDALLDDMVNLDMHVWESHGRVQDLADEYYSGDAFGADVIADLRTRAEERDLDLGDDQFRQQEGF